MPNGDQPRLFPAPRVDSAQEHVRVVWVFQREAAETRIAHGEDERLLTVASPDAPMVQRRFATIEALVEYQTELETRLRREGWVLHHVEPDRRVKADRRGQRRPGPDRRRT